MATNSKTGQLARTNVNRLLEVSGYFDGAGAANPTVLVSDGGLVSAVEWTATGIYALRLSRAFGRLLGCSYQVAADVPDDYKVCQYKGLTVVNTDTPVVMLQVFDGAGAAVDLPTTARIYFALKLSEASSGKY